MEWTSAGVKIWWWNRHNPAPADMFSANPNPASWGPPSFNWAGSGCNWDAHLANHQLIFDTTFCGDWAGNVFSSDPVCGSLGSCQNFVQNNPGAFAPAYWSISQLKVYQNPSDINGGGNGGCTCASTAIKQRVVGDATAEKKEHAEPGYKREPMKRAYTSQVAPQMVPKVSQTMNPVVASHAASSGTGAAAEQTAVAKIGDIRSARYMGRKL